jgi:hypothetical protein
MDTSFREALDLVADVPVWVVVVHVVAVIFLLVSEIRSRLERRLIFRQSASGNHQKPDTTDSLASKSDDGLTLGSVVAEPPFLV